MYTMITFTYQYYHEQYHNHNDNIDDDNDNMFHPTTSPYFYSWGIWSLCDSFLFIIICMNCSGLLFSDATKTSLLHILLILTLPFLIFLTRLPALPTNMLYIPILHAIEVVYLQNIEIENRERYITQVNTGKILLSQDKLITSLLPIDITDALRYGHTDKLASYYNNVTILFCYIVDFNKQSSAFPPQDTIELCSRIYSVMDNIVEQTGAYKVENIGDTYMACAGCPTENSDHSLIVCQTAIAIIGAAQFYAWKWPDGSIVSLKIGIHSGSVTAGVVGTKTYSYHLFGDTVNTTSRMCSNSTSGKILLSTSAYEVVTKNHKDIFEFTERGQVYVKGKGNMNLYWLNGYNSKEKKVEINYINNNNGNGSNEMSEMNESKYFDRLSALRHSEGSLIYVNLWLLRFRLRINNKIYPSKTPSSSISDTYERKVHKRRGYSVDNSSDDNIEEDIESPSNQSQCHNNAIKEDDEYNDEMSYDNSENDHKKYNKNIELSPSSKSEKGSTLNTIRIQNMTNEEIQRIEIEFKDYFALKNLKRQQNMLGIIVVYLSALVIDAILTQEQLLLKCLALGLILLVRRVALAWKLFFKYSQKIIVFFSIIMTLLTRLITNESGETQKAPMIILYIIFTALFLRLRFHYVLLYLLLLFLSALISGVYQNEKSDTLMSNFYSIATLILCGIIIYSQELASRKEFIDMYLLDKQLLKSEELLSNLLPRSEHAQQLLRGELVIENFREVTLLYSDIKGFTPLCSKIHPIQLFSLLNDIYTTFDVALNSYGLYKVDTIGDAFVVVGGMPGYYNSKNHVMNSIYYAFYMLECVRKIRIKHNVDLELRIGIHTGTCTGAVVSLNKPRYLVWGPTSNTANYMESSGEPSAVHISEQTYKLIDLQELSRLGITIECQTDLKSNSEKSYLLTYNQPESFSLPTEFCEVETKKQESLLTIALSKLRKMSIAKKAEKSSPSEKLRLSERLQLPQIKNLSTTGVLESSLLSPHSIPRTHSNNGFLISGTARSYEPVHDIEHQYPSDDNNNNNNNDKMIDDFNNDENIHLSNTQQLKPKINYEIDYFHHSAFDLNYRSPKFLLPAGWN